MHDYSDFNLEISCCYDKRVRVLVLGVDHKTFNSSVICSG